MMEDEPWTSPTEEVVLTAQPQDRIKEARYHILHRTMSITYIVRAMEIQLRTRKTSISTIPAGLNENKSERSIQTVKRNLQHYPMSSYTRSRGLSDLYSTLQHRTHYQREPTIPNHTTLLELPTKSSRYPSYPQLIWRTAFDSIYGRSNHHKQMMKTEQNSPVSYA